MITKERYEKMVNDFHTNNELNPLQVPKVLYENYWKWECRSTLARHLIESENYRDVAIELMESVVEHQPHELEGEIWALNDLVVWKTTYLKDYKVLPYIEKALKLMNELAEEPTYIDKAEIWFNNVQLLNLNSQKEKALQEVNHMLETKSKLKEPTYIYYSYLFLSEYTLQYEMDMDLAIEYLKRASACIPVEYKEIKQSIFKKEYIQDSFEVVLSKLKKIKIHD
jgi:tetratricopeptide (TPR) repeat protein